MTGKLQKFLMPRNELWEFEATFDSYFGLVHPIFPLRTFGSIPCVRDNKEFEKRYVVDASGRVWINSAQNGTMESPCLMYCLSSLICGAKTLKGFKQVWMAINEKHPPQERDPRLHRYPDELEEIALPHAACSEKERAEAMQFCRAILEDH